jgi:predicted GIY-YIG superfamily endonuclease
MSWVYIVEKQGKLCLGIITDLENRMRQHGVTRKLSD